MPYVDQEQRDKVDPSIDRLVAVMQARPIGTLNYAITRLITGYLIPSVTYTDLNEILGVLEAVKLEFNRRVVIPYEERKLAENGDVYP